MQEYKSGGSVGIRYNESVDIPFNIVLNGTNTIRDDIPDRMINSKHAILMFAAAPSFTISGSGMLAIQLDADDEDIYYYGIQSRKALYIDGTSVSIDMPGTAQTTGVDLWYNDTPLSLTNGATLSITTG